MGGGNTSTNIYDPFAGTTGLGAFQLDQILTAQPVPALTFSSWLTEDLW